MSDNKMFSFVKKIHWLIWLCLIIIFAVIRLCFLFSLRDGHHVDETWSYGYANSYFMPHVFGGYTQETEQNIGEWITGDVFGDYITVSEDQRFSFDSILYNKKDDLSPVLYPFILHFVCSLFPGQFSWGFAFFISVIFFIPSLLLIFLLSKEITDSKLCGLLAVIYYVFSGCGSSNFLYLRVYHIFTFLTLLLFFLLHRIITNNSRRMIIFYILLPVSTLLGCFTHYYFLVMAFGLTFFGMLALLFKKRIKSALCVGVIMLLSVATFFLIYSPALNKLLPYASTGGSTGVTGTTGYYSYPYYFDAAIANVHFFQGTIGWFIQFSVAGLLYFVGAVAFIAITVVLLVFLFRNEAWMKYLFSTSKSLMISSATHTARFCKKFNVSIFVALFASIFYLLVIPYSATLVNMGFTERYFFPGMTLFIIVYFSFVFNLIKEISISVNNRKLSVCIIIFSALILTFLDYRTNLLTDIFRFKKWNEKELLSELSDKDIYVVINANRDMVFFSTLLYQSNNIYIDYQSAYDVENFKVPELRDDCLLLIVDEGLMTEEQKSDLIDNNNYIINGMMKPDAMKTEEDIIGKIESDTGNTYEQTGEYLTFLGYVSIYKSHDGTED